LKMSASEEAAQNIDQTSSKKTPKQKSQYRGEVLEFHSHHLVICWRVFGG